MIGDVPTPEELVNAEKKANRLVSEYRQGDATYIQASLALKHAQELRELVLDWYRNQAKVIDARTLPEVPTGD
jgi:hypothetical protein